MVGRVVRESVTLDREGRPGRARVARAFVMAVLGSEHPLGDDAALLVSEMFGNSVRHSDSGAPGETVTVAVRSGNGVVRVEVSDRSGPGCPSWAMSAGMRRVAGACSLWRFSRRGGVAAARRADCELVRAN